MSTKEVVVSNVAEGHSNPVAELVQVACRFNSEIILESNNRRINAKSIMGMMTLCASKIDEIEVIAEGEDALAAVDHLEKFLNSAN